MRRYPISGAFHIGTSMSSHSTYPWWLRRRTTPRRKYICDICESGHARIDRKSTECLFLALSKKGAAHIVANVDKHVVQPDGAVLQRSDY